MCSQNPLVQEVWVIFKTSIHWFQLLDSLGIIEQWLQDENESHIDKTVTLLSFMQKQLPGRVAELLEHEGWYFGKVVTKIYTLN